jgi:hypothetical protein
MRLNLVAGLLVSVLGITGAHAQEINFGSRLIMLA